MTGFEHGTLALEACLVTTVPRVDFVVQRKAAVNLLLSNSRGVSSPRNSQTAAFSINHVAIHGLGIQSFSFILSDS